MKQPLHKSGIGARLYSGITLWVQNRRAGQVFTTVLLVVAAGLFGRSALSVMPIRDWWLGIKDLFTDPATLTMLVISPFLYTILVKPIRESAARQKRLNNVLAHEQENLQAIFDAAPVGMMLVDRDLVVQRVNQAVGCISGMACTEMIGQTVEAAWGCVYRPGHHGENADACTPCLFQTTLHRVLETQQRYCDIEGRCVTGARPQHDPLWIRLSAVPTVISDNLFIVVVIDDITRQRQNETRLRQAKEDAETARAQLERTAEKARALAKEATAANVAKSQFLSNMSHEIRTPMNTIVGFSDVLADEDLTEKQQQYVQTIRRSSDHLLDLINDILDFSKIEADKIRLEQIPCNISDLLEGIHSLFVTQAHKKGIVFNVTQSEELPKQILTDPTRLRQCLINLVSNALKFTLEGHIHLNVECEDGQTAHIRFDVEDTGIGIAPDKLDLIFAAFTQAEAATTRQYGGTGLGLAITRRLTLLLGGELVVRSVLGQGSVFSLSLPVQSPMAATMSEQPAVYTNGYSGETHGSNDHSLSGRVLIAEDNPDNQGLITLLLDRLGVSWDLAENGYEAVSKALQTPYSLILMDIQMPGMSGFEATRRLRARGCDTPVVALTANALPEDKQRCLDAGCTDYLSKPIRYPDLVSVLKRHLYQQQPMPVN